MVRQIGDLKLYDVEALAELLGIHERTIRKLLLEGVLKGRKLARKWYVSEDSLRSYFESQEGEISEASSSAISAPGAGR